MKLQVKFLIIYVLVFFNAVYASDNSNNTVPAREDLEDPLVIDVTEHRNEDIDLGPLSTSGSAIIIIPSYISVWRLIDSSIKGSVIVDKNIRKIELHDSLVEGEIIFKGEIPGNLRLFGKSRIGGVINGVLDNRSE